MRGLSVPHGIYVSICGTDLVRLPDGSFAVLEDNLRVPSGVSYMLANRKVLKKVFPIKYGERRPYHLWTVPPSHTAYQQSVIDVVSALRTRVQGLSQPTVAAPSTPMPTVTAPAT